MREGNVLILPGMRLEVVEACSGIRSLMSLLALAAGYGYVVERSVAVRWFMVLAMVPLAIISNGMRIMITAIMAHYIGPKAAEGFMHEFSGWVIFVVATVLFLALHSLRYVHPQEAGLVRRRRQSRSHSRCEGGSMKSGGRYWLMIAVLLGATVGLAHLSHGEATPPAKPLAAFPDKIGPWASVVEWPLDKETLDLLGATDYLNRGYWEPGMREESAGPVYRLFPQPAHRRYHSLAQKLPAGSGLEPGSVLGLPAAAG